VLMTKADIQSVHGVNEKLSFEECSRMVGFYIAYIQELGNLPGEVDIVPEVEVEPEELEDEEAPELEGAEEPEEMAMADEDAEDLSEEED